MTEKLDRPQSTGSQRVRHYQSNPMCSSAPVRVDHEGGAAAWLMGTLVVQSVKRHRLPLFKPLVAGDQKASLVSLSP